MKLNLLPTYVSKEKQIRTAVAASFGIGLISILLAVLLIVKSSADLKKVQDEANAAKPQADEAVRVANVADKVVADAQVIIRNINLAEAMNRHNGVYPSLYDEVMRYLPSFFRVTQISAVPVDGATCTVSLTGVLQSYQQYADLMLILLRIPGAESVSRSGYTVVDPFVPPLSTGSQSGRPIRPGEAPVPDDPLARLNRMMAEGASAPRGFTGTGNFGTDRSNTRGAMPDWSQITVQIVMKRNIQTPNPRATLAASAGGGGGTAPAGTPAGFNPAGGNTPPGRPQAGGGAR